MYGWSFVGLLFLSERLGIPVWIAIPISLSLAIYIEMKRDESKTIS
jgi:hypothetical protein